MQHDVAIGHRPTAIEDVKVFAKEKHLEPVDSASDVSGIPKGANLPENEAAFTCSKEKEMSNV